MKKQTLKLIFAAIILISQSFAQVGRTAVYNMWKNRVVPTTPSITSTWASFHNIFDDGTSWVTKGNAVGSNTAFIGTTDNRSFDIKTNNVRIARPDSLGVFNIGSTFTTNTSGLVRLRVKHGNSFVDIGERSNLNPAIWFNNTNNSNNSTSTNWAISGGTISTVINGPLTSIDLRVQAANILVIRGTSTVGATIPYEFTAPNTTGQTASTEIPTLKLTPGGRQYSTGNITTQREFYFRANPLSAAGTSSITNVYGGYFESPTASTNMTFGNAWGIGTNSNAHITGSLIIGSSAHTPSSSLDVTGGAVITNTLQLGNNTSTLTGGNSGTVAVLSDAVFPINFSTSSSNPSDAGTFYFGNNIYLLSTTSSNGKITLPYNCTLVGYDLTMVTSGVTSTSETSTISIAGSTTNYTLSTSVSNTGAYTSANGTGLSQNFIGGEQINAKLETPTWVTNPTLVYYGLTLWFVRRK